MDTVGHVFCASDGQHRYLAACLDANVAPNIEARCLAAGISRQTFYNWTRQPEFLDWLSAERRRVAHGELPGVMAALAARAKAGSVEHPRLFLEVAGEIGPERRLREHRHRESGNVYVNVPRPRLSLSTVDRNALSVLAGRRDCVSEDLKDLRNAEAVRFVTDVARVLRREDATRGLHENGVLRLHVGGGVREREQRSECILAVPIYYVVVPMSAIYSVRCHKAGEQHREQHQFCDC